MKTSLVISIISYLLTMVSIQSAYTLPSPDHIHVDPLHLAAQIVSGIRFLDRGFILRRGNDSVAGLTTAAIILSAAGIGIAVGAGFYIETMSRMIFLILSVEIIALTINLFGPKSLRQREIGVRLIVDDLTNIPKVMEQIRNIDIKVKNMKLKTLDTGKHFLQMKLSVHQKLRTTNVYFSLQELTNVRGTEVESL